MTKALVRIDPDSFSSFYSLVSEALANLQKKDYNYSGAQYRRAELAVKTLQASMQISFLYEFLIPVSAMAALSLLAKGLELQHHELLALETFTV